MVSGNEADRQWAETHHQSRDHIIISDDKNLILTILYLFRFKENYYMVNVFIEDIYRYHIISDFIIFQNILNYYGIAS